MSSKSFEDFEAELEEVFEYDDDNSHPTNFTTKLERRRRIEDLEEERRLLKELDEFF